MVDTEIGRLRQEELDGADQIFRLAFGTFLGVPDPSTTFGDREFVRARWGNDNTVALAARRDGVLVASNLVSRWGSLGWFGPLSVRPDLWDKGIARELMDETVRTFDRWGVSHCGLFTFGHSPKHVSLYQRYGFWPRFLTPILSKPLESDPSPPAKELGVARFSQMDSKGQEQALAECRELTGSALSGLDLTSEMRSLRDRNLGETLLVYNDSRVDGFAVCHIGRGSEAGTNGAYVKFAIVGQGSTARSRMEALLKATESHALSVGARQIEAGVNTSHQEAFRLLRDHGYRVGFIGVAMQSPNEEGYHRTGVMVLDDWR